MSAPAAGPAGEAQGQLFDLPPVLLARVDVLSRPSPAARLAAATEVA